MATTFIRRRDERMREKRPQRLPGQITPRTQYQRAIASTNDPRRKAQIMRELAAYDRKEAEYRRERQKYKESLAAQETIQEQPAEEVVTETTQETVQKPIETQEDVQTAITNINKIEQDIKNSTADKFYVNGKEVSKQEALNQLQQQRQQLNEISQNWEVYQNFNLQTGEPKWNQIPPQEWKFYPGAQEKFQQYITGREKAELLNQAFGEQYVSKAIQQYSSLIPFSLPEGVTDFKERVAKKLFLLPLNQRDARKREIVVSVLWEDFTDPQSYEKYYGQLHPLERMGKSFLKSAGQMAAGVLTFPELIIEEVGGRILTGQKQDIIPVSEEISKGYTKLGGTPGYVSTLTSLGVGLATGDTTQGREQYAEQQKYSAEAAAATFGEFAGIWAGGKAAAFGKTTASKAAYTVYKPLSVRFPSLQNLGRYKPSELARTGYYSLKQRLGLAEYIPEEQAWSPTVRAGETKYATAPGRTPSQRISSSLRIAEEARTGYFDIGTGEYPLIHATPGRFGRFGRFKVSGSSSESPMLSLSAPPYGSPTFLKMEWQPPSYSSQMSFLPKFRISGPRAPIVYFKNISQLPKQVVTGSADDVYKAAATYMEGQPIGSTAYVAPKMYVGGAELEFGFWKGGKGVKIPTKTQFTTWKGRVVPLPKYRAVDISTAGAADISQVASGASALTYSSAYSGPSYYSATGSYLKSALSIPSYNPPSTLTYPKTSSVSSIKTSQVSYSSTPSYPSSPSRPSKPSKPSYPSYSYTSTKPSKTTPPPIYYKPKTETPKKTEKTAYDVYVDSRKVNAQPLDKNTALGMGAEITDTTVATRFKVKKTKGRPTPAPRYENTWKQLKPKFSKKNSEYHEKKQYQEDFDIEKGVYRQKQPLNPIKSPKTKKTNGFTFTSLKKSINPFKTVSLGGNKK